jgi:hypothetical protein
MRSKTCWAFVPPLLCGCPGWKNVLVVAAPHVDDWATTWIRSVAFSAVPVTVMLQLASFTQAKASLPAAPATVSSPADAVKSADVAQPFFDAQ